MITTILDWVRVLGAGGFIVVGFVMPVAARSDRLLSRGLILLGIGILLDGGLLVRWTGADQALENMITLVSLVPMLGGLWLLVRSRRARTEEHEQLMRAATPPAP